MQSNKCPQCGFDLIPNANFCYNCGKPIEKTLPQDENLYQEVQSSTEDKLEGMSESHPEAKSQIILDTEPLEVDEEELGTVTDEIVDEAEGEEIIFGAQNDDNQQEAQETSTHSEEELDIVANEESTDHHRRILGVPEWALYTGVLIAGIIAVVAININNEPQWVKSLFEVKTVAVDSSKTHPDSLKIVAPVVDTVVTEIAKDQSEVDSNMIKQTPAIEMPSRSGADTDTAYHVVITTIKDEEKAQRLAKESSYKDAYVISKDDKHSIAVFRSIKKDEAQLYMDSIVKKDHPDAWLYRGVVK